MTEHVLEHPLSSTKPRFRQGGSDHLAVTCRTLLDTHNPYRVEDIVWPSLAPDVARRLTTLPIWDLAVQTEGDTSLRVAAFAKTIAHPLLREAVELDAFEEQRHKRLLAGLVDAYGIELAPEPLYRAPKDPEFWFLATGFSECLDSFFAFGLFAAARDQSYFPPDLVAVFEPVMQEEARHILFFVNWLSWRRHSLPVWKLPGFFVRVIAAFALVSWERLQTAASLGGGSNFVVQGHETLQLDIDLPRLIDLSLAENDRRLAPYDARLARPTFVPRLARIVRRMIRLFEH